MPSQKAMEMSKKHNVPIQCFQYPVPMSDCELEILDGSLEVILAGAKHPKYNALMKIVKNAKQKAPEHSVYQTNPEA